MRLGAACGIGALAFVLTACTGGTPSVTPLATPSPSEGPGAAANVTCGALSFYLDPALASSFTCETVPADPGPVAPHPEYTRVTLQGYPVASQNWTPQVSVLSVADYSALEPDQIPTYLADLQSLTGGGPSPLFDASTGSSLPFLPEQGAAEVFFARYGMVPFVSGTGVRFLTELAQDAEPIANNVTIYTFQGLTDDGQYWVSAILPIANPILPATGDNPPGGATWDEFWAGYEAYLTDTVGQLDAAGQGSFTPTISALDELVLSISVVP